ncbi:hypothetical protein PR002_g11226 [Phytophthora rubi]|nr:hypothetical protein PR002_g11226 [Phytophthora rubi]
MQFGRRVLSFREADDAANRVAHWGLQQGLQVGQTVALLMENRPEFVSLHVRSHTRALTCKIK